MKKTISIFCNSFLVLVVAAIACSFMLRPVAENAQVSFPYKKAGLTERQAAAHLLNRFTFGPRPGDVDRVVEMGLEKWFKQQLEANLNSDTLSQLLVPYDALNLSNEEIADTYPKGAQLLRMAIRDGYINKDSVNNNTDKKAYRDQLQAYMKDKNLKPLQNLYTQLFNQKILRATYSENQLQEVLTDFWFNHFNVSLTKNDCAPYVLPYERDIIRPNVLGNFEKMLTGTAKSPAMLYYLDNFTSMGENLGSPTPRTARQQRAIENRAREMEADTSAKAIAFKKLQQQRRARGLNENYAREVMELHTLGVDGGYTQQDVTQAAKILTGWTVYPFKDYGGNAARNQMERLGEDKMARQGFVREGDFLFAANRHDKSAKVVLNKKFAEGGGYEEGVELLHMLAHHPSTAKFISKKLAVRFVNDDPPQSLIDKMAKTFLAKEGNIREVLITMVSAPEFWSKEALREKTKSPFELAISAVRNLNATIKQPYQLYNWINKMGQRLYYYQAPTGFPDNGKYWINTGSLLNRMNFGLALASNRIPGISVDLYALNNHHEPESAEAALATYGKMIMPERDLTASIKRLTPLLNAPDLDKKVDEAAGRTNTSQQATMMQANDEAVEMDETAALGEPGKRGKGGKGIKKNPNKIPKNPNKNDYASLPMTKGNNSMLSQVVGIIIGSPEFQRK